MGHAISFLFSLTHLLYLCLASYVHLGVEIFSQKCFFIFDFGCCVELLGL
ncbi:hypothetical protein GLYMA_06G293350v4 [Glycine max]|nr:hypothetical protein GLYMA_06G293350v4 [Glycine max]KAH1128116.1 hypothetical protein GYH30_016607 [Glycine max]